MRFNGQTGEFEIDPNIPEDTSRLQFIPHTFTFIWKEGGSQNYYRF